MSAAVQKKEKKAIRIVHIFGVFIIAMGIIALILIIGSSRVDKALVGMQESTDKYIVEENSISVMREVSDYLTEKCQAFISTGDVADAKAYFKEVDIDKNREASLEAIEPYGNDDVIYTSLKKALNSSNELAENEVYAMRLAAEGYGMSPAEIEDISKVLTDVKLTGEDQALTEQQKRLKARKMVFDDSYDNKKTEIWNSVLDSTERLMENTRQRELEYYNNARRNIIIQNILTVVLLSLVLVLAGLTARMVILPMRASTRYIQRDKALPLEGAAEYMYLAKEYNKMLEKTRAHHEILSYEATHDEMTSLYNRKFFEMKREELSGEDTALMFVDVDHFKSINDTYGHETGDKVLQKVSGILASSFRSEDFICRIGGDEFAVLMVQMHPNLRHVIEDKIANVNNLLKNSGDDGLPDVTVSIGVAFCGEGTDANTPDELFNNADKALYKAKEAGRDRYAFYEDTVSV